jgi:hypothetical protein
MPQATCLVSPAVSLDRIPPRVRRFVAEHIQSVTQLELLLLLHGDPAMERTAEEWGREMRRPAVWTAAQLERFVAAGLVVSSGGNVRRYAFHPHDAVPRSVDEVAETYRRQPTSMTALIFSPQPRVTR